MLVSLLRTVLMYGVILLAVRLLGKGRSASCRPLSWWLNLSAS